MACILALDTAFVNCTVAISAPPTTVVKTQPASKQQTKFILPMLKDCLASAQLSLSMIDAVAYVAGPGNFTGVRIAAALAQSLGYALAKPLIQIPSGVGLAHTAYLQWGDLNYLVVQDARMQQVYWGWYAKETIVPSDHRQIMGEAPPGILGSPSAITYSYPSATRPWAAIGDGFAAYQELILGQAHMPPTIVNAVNYISGHALLQIAEFYYFKQRVTGPFDAAALYFR